LLSTKTLNLLSQEKCKDAISTWEYRNSFRQQQLSKCTALISAQVLACDQELDQNNKLIESVLIGVGQDPGSFEDYTEAAIRSLADQANTTFSSCYLGLRFPKDKVLNGMLKVVSSNKHVN